MKEENQEKKKKKQPMVTLQSCNVTNCKVPTLPNW
jgi:hypothetical protein